MPHGNGSPRGVAGFRTAQIINPYDDTFDGASLNSKWLLSGTSPGPSVSSGAVSFSAMGSGRYIRQLLQSTMTNMTLYARVSALSSSNAMTGLLATDSAGTGVGFSAYNSPNGCYLWNVSSGVYSSTGPSIGIVNPDMWLRLRKSGTSWYGATATHDTTKTYLGQTWSGETTVLTNGSTITHIGFGSIINGTVTATLEEFRLVPA